MKKCKKRLLDLSIIDRDYETEKEYGVENLNIFGYLVDEDSIAICGEIISSNLKNNFNLYCRAYDKDDDLVDTDENSLTYSINPNAFYSGFPFSFFLSVPDNTMISRIEIELKYD